MTKDKTYDPFVGVKRISEMWEKQLNGLLYMMTDNNEFVRLMKVGTESHARYMELLRKNQELMAGLMNIPTKKDVADVAKISIQSEEKIDKLEEQIWNLQDSMSSLNNEYLEVLKAVNQELSQLKDIRAELASIKTILAKGKGKEKEKEKELVLTGAGASK